MLMDKMSLKEPAFGKISYERTILTEKLGWVGLRLDREFPQRSTTFLDGSFYLRLSLLFDPD